MKKLASAFGISILLATAMPAGATSAPGYGVMASQMAFAGWLVRDHGETWLYFGAGMNDALSTSVSMGFVGRAPCKEIVRRGRVGLRCRGGARGRTLNPGDFLLDPTLNSGSLTMESKGFTHEISWTGRGKQAEPYWHEHSGPGVGAMGMVMMWRNANTTGNLYGKKMEQKRGVMFEDVYADVWVNFLTTADGTRLSLDDNVLRVSKTFF